MINSLVKGWYWYELMWLGVFMGTAVGITLYMGDNVFGLTVFIAGVFCVVLAAKGNIWTYIFGMYNTLAYGWLAYNNGLFGEAGLNLLFFMPMNFVGFFLWRRKINRGTVIMKTLKPSMKIITGVIVICGTAGLGYSLSLMPAQNSPYIDALTNVLSVSATLLMVMRFTEQWILYIILNIFTIILWSFRLYNGSSDGLIMMVMWSAYLVNAVYGYYNWSKGVKNDNRSDAGEIRSAA